MSQAMAKLAPMPAATRCRPQITGLATALIRCSIAAYCSGSTGGTWRSSGWSATFPSLELGAPLLEEGVHAFLLALGREQEVEVLAFGEGPLLERKLKGEIDRFPGQAERHPGLGPQLPGHALGSLDRHLGRHDLVDDAE